MGGGVHLVDLGAHREIYRMMNYLFQEYWLLVLNGEILSRVTTIVGVLSSILKHLTTLLKCLKFTSELIFTYTH